MSEYSKQCKVAGISTMIIGEIAVVMLALNKAKIVGYYEDDFDVMVFFTWLILGSVIVEVFAMMLLGMSEVLEKLTRILYMQNSSNSSSLNNAGVLYGNERIMDNGGWKCNKCGRVNASYTGTCGCGGIKPSK